MLLRQASIRPWISGIAASVVLVVSASTYADVTKHTIYVDTAGIDKRDDLNDDQKQALKDLIAADVWANFALAVGDENVKVSYDPKDRKGASRIVEILNSFHPKGANAWGATTMDGKGKGRVFLKKFMEGAGSAAYKTDGQWDVDKLGNSLGHTAGHELAHTFSVGHNSDRGEDLNKTTRGGYHDLEKATRTWVFDDYADKTILANWDKPACKSAPDYTNPVLEAEFWGDPLWEWSQEDYGGLDTILTLDGDLAAQFRLGFLGRDSDDGVFDGSADFDFIYKSSMEGTDFDAPMITFFSPWQRYTQFLLERVSDGQWFMLDPTNVLLEDLIVQPDGDDVARLVTMGWDVDDVFGVDIEVTLDTNAFGGDSNPYNGFRYVIVPGASSLTLISLGCALTIKRRR